MITIDDIFDTFPRDIESAANRVAYGAETGGLIETAARVWRAPYERRAHFGSSNGALQCSVYMPPQPPRGSRE